MLLRVGVISLSFSLTLALVVAILTSYGYGSETRSAVAEPEKPAVTEHSASREPVVPTSLPKPAFLPNLSDEKPISQPETTPQRRSPASADGKEPSGKAEAPSASRKEARPTTKARNKVPRTPELRPRLRRQKQEAQATKTPEQEPKFKSRPGVSQRNTNNREAYRKTGWTGVARRTELNLTIESIGLRGAPVKSTGRQRALDNGLVRMPQSSLPWDRGSAKNVYLVGHRLGWPGTGSWKIFYELDELRRGDKVSLTDRRGKVYRYRVSERLVVSPSDVWVMDRVRGRDMVTLQTCTGPNFSQRLIVRADRM